MEERNGFTIKDLLIRLVLIIVFVFLLIWLFPMPDLKPLNNQIFADNIDRMKDVARSYYTIERLPSNINDSKRMTLKEMIDSHLILPLTDSNGKTCSEDDSYVEITKAENEYLIKVYLSCSDKQDYIITHFGCYDICSNECKMLETTTYTYRDETTTRRRTTYRPAPTTTQPRVTTSKVHKIYEYEYVRNNCTEVFDKYVCPIGYDLVGDTCFKKGSETITEDAKEKTEEIKETDTKPAKPIEDSSSEIIGATCEEKEKTTTIDANPSSVEVDKIKVTKTQKITANQHKKYDVKGAIITTIRADKIKFQNYDIKDAQKLQIGYTWKYTSTITSHDSSLAYNGSDRKVVLVDSWTELACDTCSTTVVVYRYWEYKKEYKYAYSCAAFPGYSPYGDKQCRKPTTITEKCPDGFKEDAKGCYKTGALSCAKYGSDYVLDEANKVCLKTIISYSCPEGSTPTNDERYCTRQVETYECPAGTKEDANGKCSKTTYTCPPDTDDAKYTQIGNKCIKKEKVKVCTCPPGTIQNEDKETCTKITSSTKYTCEDYDGYELVDTNKCVKTIITQKKTYYCEGEGFTLDEKNKKCIKTVDTTESKKAEKKYKPVCEQEYIWSTKTSLEGWTYTGNKREIN